ncbi:MAG: class I tRNA ligase family protein [Planctomycetales bacterium]|nr:class I tRNA ligase family protein [Planctomycetales bacterium]
MMNLVPMEPASTEASGGRQPPGSVAAPPTEPEGLRPPLAKSLGGYTPGEVTDADLMLEDRWILSRLSTTATQVTQMLDGYHFDTATRAIRDFTWNEFCDWYLEMIKPRLRDETLRPAAQRMLAGVLDTLLRLLSPFTPFIAEELWQRLGEIAPTRGLLTPQPAAEAAMIAPWPVLPAAWRDEQLESRFERLQETINAVRNVRAVYGIASGIELSLHVKCGDEVASQFQGVAGQFENLAKTVLKAAGVHVERPKGAATFSLSDSDGFIPLEGIINREAEIGRQKKEADKLRGFISGNEKKLTNESFVSKAPPDVVAQVRESLAGLRKQRESIEAVIQQLSDG